MSLFSFYFPTRLVFGSGKFTTIGEEVAKLGKRAMLVSYADNSQAAVIGQAVDLLKQAGVSTVVFAEAVANPSNVLIDRGSQLARDERCVKSR